MKRIIFIIGALSLLVLPATLANCKSVEQVESDYPFEMQYVLGEGQVIGFSGYASGHTPGESSEFLVTLMNRGVETWNDRYFIQLVDETAVVSTLHEAPISVGPGTSEIFPVSVTFPSNLERKEYGLAVFIPNRMAAITNIFIGVDYQPETATTEWAEPEVP